MPTRARTTRKRLEDFTPEERAKIKAAKARAPDARAEEAEARRAFADKPSMAELTRRGDFDPTIATTGNLRYALRRAVGALRQAREAKGLSLADVAEPQAS